MLELRPYQDEAIERLRAFFRAGYFRLVLGLPTGSGKTVIAADIIQKSVGKGIRVLFIGDRIILVNQVRDYLESLGLKVGIMQGSNTAWCLDDDVIVASIQTINKRPPPECGLIVIDEVHLFHAAHKKLLDARPDVPVIGLSATPFNPALSDYFTGLVASVTTKELTLQNYLVRARAFCPSADDVLVALSGIGVRGGDYKADQLASLATSGFLYGDIVTTWLSKAADRLTILFACNVEHSKTLCADFVSRGISAEHIDGEMSQAERAQIIERFKAGKVRVLCSVELLSIGFDMPEVSCAILARPTLSKSLHFQQLGRVVRPAPGKVDAMILDHATNTLRFGLPIDLVLPESLEDNRKKPKAKELKALSLYMTCPECGAVMNPAEYCPECGYEIPHGVRRLSKVDGVLVEFGDDEGNPDHEYSLDEKRDWYLALAGYGEKQVNRKTGEPWKPGWSAVAYKDKFGVGPQGDWKALPTRWPTQGQRRWIGQFRERQGVYSVTSKLR